MSLLPTLLSRLRLPLAILSGSLAAATATLAWTLAWKGASELRRDREAARVAQSEASLHKQPGADEAIILEAIGLRLRDSGVLAGEGRMRWIRTLHRLQRELGLPAMNYQFEGGRPQPGPADERFALMAMKLQLEVLHEEDLLAFLSGLEQAGTPPARLRGCLLSRSSRPGTNLEAICDIDWLALNVGKERSP